MYHINIHTYLSDCVMWIQIQFAIEDGCHHCMNQLWPHSCHDISLIVIFCFAAGAIPVFIPDGLGIPGYAMNAYYIDLNLIVRAWRIELRILYFDGKLENNKFLIEMTYIPDMCLVKTMNRLYSIKQFILISMHNRLSITKSFP